jgi:hypothetical protein
MLNACPLIPQFTMIWLTGEYLRVGVQPRGCVTTLRLPLLGLLGLQAV